MTKKRFPKGLVYGIITFLIILWWILVYDYIANWAGTYKTILLIGIPIILIILIIFGVLSPKKIRRTINKRNPYG